MSVYLVDSNFFIQAHRLNYPLDVAHSFWEKVKELAAAGKIISVDKVKNEIYKNEDDLKKWCVDNLPNDFFKDSSTIMSEYGQVVGWAASMSSHYLPRAINEFLDADEADAWLIAYAMANTNIIVTQELSQPDRKNKIKIPEACAPFSVQFINTIEMFRQLGEKF